MITWTENHNLGPALECIMRAIVPVAEDCV
jgi:hypothetical protein